MIGMARENQREMEHFFFLLNRKLEVHCNHDLYLFFRTHTSICFHNLETNYIKNEQNILNPFNTIQFKGCAISSSFKVLFQIHIHAYNQCIQRLFNIIKELIKTTKRNFFFSFSPGSTFPLLLKFIYSSNRYIYVR